jgi:hypothetical protein
MAYTPSNSPSSILISMIWAPPSTCSRAFSSASSLFLFLNQSKIFANPSRLVRSTRSQTLSGVIIKGSNPDKIKFFSSLYCHFLLYLFLQVSKPCWSNLFFIIWCSPRRNGLYAIFCSAIAAQRMPLLSLTRVLCIVRSFLFQPNDAVL